MFIPKRYRITDIDTIRAFVAEYEFGTLFSQSAGKPWATHIPMQWFSDGSPHGVLRTHISKANSQWKDMEGQTVLAVFLGPHVHITPTWYDHVNVPTWNYASVHIMGCARIIEDPKAIREMLTVLVDTYESAHGNTYSVQSLPEDYYNREVQGLVGIEIQIENVDAAFKLSQNRHRSDYENIICQLRNSNDENSHRIADLMEKHTPEFS
ncbi:MAG TPA: FMN-binding negative transcriptional regulator [bacterium]|nr:FMN-binding negative transcriptional regulator [bacterium]HMY35468.1 FMN-binding negative transcriptional regulator [bacterium]HMZ03226.1 FMN-binding negative transcriptional regulator [bacterium]HNB10153.1 FMN-binding negative transcriptional regulator [bacterium]HNC47561.1 FMN-binding negative transcriptional regulator [bacterium]